MIKIERVDVFGWEAAIREFYNGKGVRWVYPNSYEAYISTHGNFFLVVHMQLRNKHEKPL